MIVTSIRIGALSSQAARHVEADPKHGPIAFRLSIAFALSRSFS
jgi:hypothetical protein